MFMGSKAVTPPKPVTSSYMTPRAAIVSGVWRVVVGVWRMTYDMWRGEPKFRLGV
jgi:hypothetical protein